jgi:hypothetical protein
MSVYPDPALCSQEQLDELFPYVGKVAVTWSSAENSMDMLVALVFQSAPDRPNEPEIPQAFERKAKYLRKAFGNAAVMKPFEAQGRNAVDFMLAASEQRHALIHGVLLGYDQKNKGYEFSKLDLPKDENKKRIKHYERRVVFTLDALETLANSLVRVDRDLTEIAERVFDAFDALDQGNQDR